MSPKTRRSGIIQVWTYHNRILKVAELQKLIYATILIWNAKHGLKSDFKWCSRLVLACCRRKDLNYLPLSHFRCYFIFPLKRKQIIESYLRTIVLCLRVKKLELLGLHFRVNPETKHFYSSHSQARLYPDLYPSQIHRFRKFRELFEQFTFYVLLKWRMFGSFQTSSQGHLTANTWKFRYRNTKGVQN